MEEFLCLENFYKPVAHSESYKLCPLRQIFVLLKLEQDYSVRKLENAVITLTRQEMLFQWICQVCITRQEDVYANAVNLCGRFFNRYSSQITSEHQLQIIGVACLRLASKLQETIPISAEEAAYFTDDAYSASDIKAMETIVASVLDFDLFSVSPGHFLDPLLILLNVQLERRIAVKNATSQRINLALIDPNLVCHRSSVLAAACLLAALSTDAKCQLDGTLAKRLSSYVNIDETELLQICDETILAFNKNCGDVYDAMSYNKEIQRQNSATGNSVIDFSENEQQNFSMMENDSDEEDDCEYMDEEDDDDEMEMDEGISVEDEEESDEITKNSASIVVDYLIDSDSGIQDEDDHYHLVPYAVSVPEYFTQSEDA